MILQFFFRVIPVSTHPLKSFPDCWDFFYFAKPLKWQVVNVFCLPSGLYVGESWTIRKAERREIDRAS